MNKYVFDLQDLLELVGDDMELVVELAELFLDTYPEELAAIDAAVVENDVKKLERAAHSLKGSLGNLRAHRSADAAFVVEQAARSGRTDGIDGFIATLKQELADLRKALEGVMMSA